MVYSFDHPWMLLNYNFTNNGTCKETRRAVFASGFLLSVRGSFEWWAILCWLTKLGKNEIFATELLGVCNNFKLHVINSLFSFFRPVPMEIQLEWSSKSPLWESLQRVILRGTIRLVGWIWMNDITPDAIHSQVKLNWVIGPRISSTKFPENCWNYRKICKRSPEHLLTSGLLK